MEVGIIKKLNETGFGGRLLRFINTLSKPHAVKNGAAKKASSAFTVFLP